MRTIARVVGVAVIRESEIIACVWRYIAFMNMASSKRPNGSAFAFSGPIQ